MEDVDKASAMILGVFVILMVLLGISIIPTNTIVIGDTVKQTDNGEVHVQIVEKYNVFGTFICATKRMKK